MKRAVIGVAAMVAALTACASQTTCYGVEPDGEVEKLRPCPQGWKDGETRQIGEDQFKELEVVDLKSKKNNQTTVTVKVSVPKTSPKKVP